MPLQETERKIQLEPVLPELVVYKEDVPRDAILSPTVTLLEQVVVFQADDVLVSDTTGMLGPVLVRRRKHGPKQTSLDIRTREEARREGKPRTQTGGGAKLPPPPAPPYRFSQPATDEPDDAMRKKLEIDQISRARDYDPIAYGEIYERYFNGVYKFIYYRIGDQNLAEDMTMTVFVKALEAIDTFTFRGVPFSAWLYRIAHNLIVDNYRRQPKQPMLSLEEKLITTGEDSATVLDSEFTHQALKQALSVLTDDQQRVLLLKFVDGLNNQEVGRVLGKTEGAVKSLQHRAIAAMGRTLGEQGEVPDSTVTNEIPTKPLRQIDMHVGPGYLYDFEIALFREESHPFHAMLQESPRGIETSMERWGYWKDIIVPALQGQSVNTREVMYHIIYDGMRLEEIKELMPTVDVEKVLKDVRIEIREILKDKTGMEFWELYRLFKGTRATHTFCSPLKAEEDNQSQEERYFREKTKQRRPARHQFTYNPLTLTPSDLDRFFGRSSAEGDQWTQADLDRWLRILSSGITVCIPAGVRLESRNNVSIIIHRGEALASQIMQGDELIVLKRGIKQKFRAGNEGLVGSVPMQGFKSVASDVLTTKSCIIRILHPNALTDAKPREIQQRVQELQEWYEDLPVLSLVNEQIGLIAPTGINRHRFHTR